MRVYGAGLINSENQTIQTRRLLTDHLVEDVGRVVTVEDWAKDLMPDRTDSFYKFLVKKREQIEADQVPGENVLLAAFKLSEKDRVSLKAFLDFPLKKSSHAGAMLVSHNSFAVYLAEKFLGVAFVKAGTNLNDANPINSLVPVREISERVKFHRMKMIYSPAEIIARAGMQVWMRDLRSRN